MKNKITKTTFNNFIKEILVNNQVSNLTEKNVNEFKIGKNYFYSVINNQKLIQIQKKINKAFQKAIPINNSAIAFRENYSYLHLFEPHRKNYHFLRLDIKSFFHSINIIDIQKALEEYFEKEYLDDRKQQTLINAFLNIVTYTIPEESDNIDFRKKQVLPMGFITSPVISNIIFRKLDIQIQKICSERNIIYTRYADDMLFSSDKSMNYIHSNTFTNEIAIIVSQLKFKLNPHKTIKSKHTISVNGYTIQHSAFQKNLEDIITDEKEYQIHELRISNKKLDIITKLIHLIEKENRTPKIILKKLFNYKLPSSVPKEKIEEFCTHQLINKLTGYRSYLLSIIVFNNKYNCCQQNTIIKYLEKINNLNELIIAYNEKASQQKLGKRN